MMDWDKNRESALKSIKDDKHRKLVAKFIKSCGKVSHVSMVEHEKNFEIIITHPSHTDNSGERYTGGAEQYFLDKETGKVKMGWHEHPMNLSD